MPPRIGFLGAYSLDNPGDNLLGFATRQAVRELVPVAEQVAFAPEIPVSWFHHDWSRARGIDCELVRVPADESVEWARGLDALIIGGGGLILPEPGFRPFLLGDPARWPGEVPASWSGVCSQCHPWYLDELAGEYERARRCAERLAYVSVRNRTTEAYLRGCGYRGVVHVVPDAALSLQELPGPDLSEEVLRAAGVPAGALRVGLTVGRSLRYPRAAPFYADLLRFLDAVTRRSRPVCVVLFPFAPVYGERELLREVAARLPATRPVSTPLRPADAWRLVGHLDLYLGPRFHGMLAAFCQGTTFVVVDEYLFDWVGSSKNREFVVDNRLEPHYLAPLLSTKPSTKVEALLGRVERLGRQGAVSFDEALAGQRARLRAHFGAMVAALGLLPAENRAEPAPSYGG